VTKEEQDRLRDMLKTHEGLRLKPYRCPAGKITIGYGRNLEDRGITTEEAEQMLENDITSITQSLYEEIPFFYQLDPVRQSVLIDMAFNLGIGGLLGFRNTLRMIDAGDWEKAAQNMMDSKWARQVKGRALRLSEMIRTGKYKS